MSLDRRSGSNHDAGLTIIRRKKELLSLWPMRKKCLAVWKKTDKVILALIAGLVAKRVLLKSEFDPWKHSNGSDDGAY